MRLPPLRFGSLNDWIGLVIGTSRCMAVIPSGAASLILGRSLQTLAGLYFSGSSHHPKCIKTVSKSETSRYQMHQKTRTAFWYFGSSGGNCSEVTLAPLDFECQCHCSVGATDTFGCWQVGAATLKEDAGKIWLRVPGVLHGRYPKSSKGQPKCIQNRFGFRHP